MRAFTERRSWLVGLISMILIAAGVLLAFSVNRFDSLRGVYQLSADLKDAAGLQPGNEVRVAGVKVGNVKEIELTSDAARIRMEIQDNIEIPLETRLEVKLKTLLGQKFVDLRFPRSYVASVEDGGNGVTSGFFESGDVIPLDQTEIPYEIYQAANEGTAALAEIDKKAVRRMLDALTDVVGRSKEELRTVLVDVDRAGEVLSGKNEEIARLLRNLQAVSGTLAGGRGDVDKILGRASVVLETLAERRQTIRTLLRATNDLGENLSLLINTARRPLQAGAADLNSFMLVLQEELDTIGAALEELPTAQEMFARPLAFGRFIETHICAVTTEDTCVPEGTPRRPGLPAKGTQPEASIARARPLP